MAKRRRLEPGVIPSLPHPARVYNYLLGGKDNFAVDRSAGDVIVASVPEARAGARAQRALLGRVVRFLVADAGLRQLLDIGAGLPAAENVHEIAQRIDPATRVVYVDHDPVVLAHARALLAVNASTKVAEGDLLDPAAILDHPVVRGHLDWERPIGLLMSNVLHMVTDSERPGEAIATLAGALPSGSYVFIQHFLSTVPGGVALPRAFDRFQLRTLEQVHALFGGLELVEPGLVAVPDWRPDGQESSGTDQPALREMACAAVARKA